MWAFLSINLLNFLKSLYPKENDKVAFGGRVFVVAGYKGFHGEKGKQLCLILAGVVEELKKTLIVGIYFGVKERGMNFVVI